jgi:hypothetical protein
MKLKIKNNVEGTVTSATVGTNKRGMLVVEFCTKQKYVDDVKVCISPTLGTLDINLYGEKEWEATITVKAEHGSDLAKFRERDHIVHALKHQYSVVLMPYSDMEIETIITEES